MGETTQHERTGQPTCPTTITPRSREIVSIIKQSNDMGGNILDHRGKHPLPQKATAARLDSELELPDQM